MNGDKPVTILAVGGHVGDMELTAGGVLAANALSGGKIFTLALTAGEKGAPAGADLAQYRLQKAREAETFAEMLGGEASVFDYPDGLLPDSDEVRMRVCDVIRRVKPDVVITHFKNSMHKDHAAASRITSDALFYASNAYFKRDLPSVSCPRLYFAENWEDSEGFKPYIYAKVSEEGFKLWQKAVRVNKFVTESKSFDYFNYYSSLLRVRGIEARTEYAESFMILPECTKICRDVL